VFAVLAPYLKLAGQQGVDLGSVVSPMTAEGPNTGQLAGFRPSGDRLGADAEYGRYL
jgi:hypothetical protein